MIGIRFCPVSAARARGIVAGRAKGPGVGARSGRHAMPVQAIPHQRVLACRHRHRTGQFAEHAALRVVDGGGHIAGSVEGEWDVGGVGEDGREKEEREEGFHAYGKTSGCERI